MSHAALRRETTVFLPLMTLHKQHSNMCLSCGISLHWTTWQPRAPIGWNSFHLQRSRLRGLQNATGACILRGVSSKWVNCSSRFKNVLNSSFMFTAAPVLFPSKWFAISSMQWRLQPHCDQLIMRSWGKRTGTKSKHLHWCYCISDSKLQQVPQFVWGQFVLFHCWSALD